MSAIAKMLEVADLLMTQRRYRESFTIYDELYRQIWSVFGTVQGGLARFANGFLGSNISSDYEFRRQYTEPAANALCAKMYNIDLNLALFEFIRIIIGHLQCLSYSKYVVEELTTDIVLSEFLVLYTLAVQPANDRKITPVFNVVTAAVDENSRFKKIRPNYTRSMVERLLSESAEKVKETEWKSINHLLLDFLFNVGEQNSKLFDTVRKIVGSHSYRAHHRHHSYQKYEKYERYERYESYERFEQKTGQSDQKEFDPTRSTDDEKTAFYGKLLGLKGRLTRSQVRTRYLDLISLYHPDKVQHLGSELKDLAEKKTKEINAAYEWMKSHFGI